MGPEPPPPPAPTPPPTYPPAPPPPARPRRLMRSRRDHMWAGVAGGIAEYFELDSSLVRLLWVIATVVTHGLAVPVYILAWIILPRDDQAPVEPAHGWHQWSNDVRAEAQHVADEARHVADEVRDDWWRSERFVDRYRGHYHGRRSAGVVLVGLGVLLLAANTGILGAIDWQMMWPLIFIGLGLLLLARQSGWGR